MALYIPHSIFHLARLLYVRPETFGPYYVDTHMIFEKAFLRHRRNIVYLVRSVLTEVAVISKQTE